MKENNLKKIYGLLIEAVTCLKSACENFLVDSNHVNTGVS